jgi:hypothetical protein
VNKTGFFTASEASHLGKHDGTIGCGCGCLFYETSIQGYRLGIEKDILIVKFASNLSLLNSSAVRQEQTFRREASNYA